MLAQCVVLFLCGIDPLRRFGVVRAYALRQFTDGFFHILHAPDDFKGVLDLLKRILKRCLLVLRVVACVIFQRLFDVLFSGFQNFFVLRLHIVRRNVLRLLDVLSIGSLFGLIDLIQQILCVIYKPLNDLLFIVGQIFIFQTVVEIVQIVLDGFFIGGGNIARSNIAERFGQALRWFRGNGKGSGIVGYFLSITTIPFASFHIGLLAMLCIPMILDGLVQLKTNYVSTNPKRFASGLLFGYGFLGVPIQIIKIIA